MSESKIPLWSPDGKKEMHTRANAYDLKTHCGWTDVNPSARKEAAEAELEALKVAEDKSEDKKAENKKEDAKNASKEKTEDKGSSSEPAKTLSFQK